WTSLLYFLKIDETDVDAFLRAWKLSNKEINDTKRAYHALHKRLERYWDYSLLFQTGLPIALEVEGLIAGFGLDNDFEGLLAMDRTIPIHTVKDLKVDGKDIMAVLSMQR